MTHAYSAVCVFGYGMSACWKFLYTTTYFLYLNGSQLISDRKQRCNARFVYSAFCFDLLHCIPASVHAQYIIYGTVASSHLACTHLLHVISVTVDFFKL